MRENCEASAHYGIGQTGQIRSYIDEDMNYAFANRNAIFYVQGPKVSVLHSETDWNAMQAIYSQTHDGKQIKVFDWMDNNSTADAVFRTLGYYEDEAFRNSVTEGIENIKKNLK